MSAFRRLRALLNRRGGTIRPPRGDDDLIRVKLSDGFTVCGSCGRVAARVSLGDAPGEAARILSMHQETCTGPVKVALPAECDVVHQAPLTGDCVTPCCGHTPFELPAAHRITSDPALATCGKEPG